MVFHRSAVANGLRTDHPIPDLPFVDDSHIPVDDPRAVAAVGRHREEDMWGRYDTVRDGGGWVAFTTDPTRHDLAWCIRWHPEHGRAVALYRDKDAAGMHMTLGRTLPALLFRAGGYWWDGTCWYRPAQLWDPPNETYVRCRVPAAMTVTAADLLPADLDPYRGHVLDVSEVEPDVPWSGRWRDDVALWAARRVSSGRGDLVDCVVTLTAPELSGDQLVSVAGLAEIGGVAASTLRAYLTRGEGDIPDPQATVNGRSMWSRPVAEDWAEQRRRSPDSVKAAVSTGQIGSTSAPVGIAEVCNRFTRIFFSALWTHPERRKRWALRWRNEDAVRTVAEDLSWYVAADLTGTSDGIIPITDLTDAIHQATLYELVTSLRLGQHAADDIPIANLEYVIEVPVARMLGWLVRHNPNEGARAIHAIIGDAERDLHIPREVTERSLRTALEDHGELDDTTLAEFFKRVMSPSTS